MKDKEDRVVFSAFHFYAYQGKHSWRDRTDRCNWIRERRHQCCQVYSAYAGKNRCYKTAETRLPRGEIVL